MKPQYIDYPNCCGCVAGMLVARRPASEALPRQHFIHQKVEDVVFVWARSSRSSGPLGSLA
jgi:hypothetical protein